MNIYKKMNINIKKEHIKSIVFSRGFASYTRDRYGRIVSAMEKQQKINCTVTSCKYNNRQRQECKLDSIIVTPVEGVNTKSPDESMCSSYDYE